MTEREPVAELVAFSSPASLTRMGSGARIPAGCPVELAVVGAPDGRPNITPLLESGWTAPCPSAPVPRAQSREPRQNLCCVPTTGRNTLDGLDLVVAGEAAAVSDETVFRNVADAFDSKYGSHFTPPDIT
jgi:hypothetical protein